MMYLERAALVAVIVVLAAGLLARAVYWLVIALLFGRV